MVLEAESNDNLNSLTYSIQNIVVKSALNIETKLDLVRLSKNLNDSKYDSTRFPGLFTRYNHPKCAIIIFSNGKLVRAAGAAAKVHAKQEDKISVLLPSKKLVLLNPNCRAVVGRLAAGGKTEKPFVKAGNKFKAMHAKNKMYPRTHGVAMNACDHPFGGTHRRTKGRPLQASKRTPPGRKVGSIAPKRTGRKKK